MMKELSQEQTEYAVGCFVSIYQSRGIKQTELSTLSGVDQSTISKILKPRDSGENYCPSADVLQKLFQALGVKLAHILCEADHLADEILGYLATPLTGLTPTEDKEVRRAVSVLRRLAGDAQYQNPRFELYWPGDHTHPKQHSSIVPPQVYITDRSRASSHDFIVLLCALPSCGVGQENEIATQAGVPAIRLVPPVGLSRMMLGSFLRAIDIPYSGDLQSGLVLDETRFHAALDQIRNSYFRNRAFYRAMNGDGFGKRLRKLINERCGGDYSQFAADVGINLACLHALMDEPFVVANPGAVLLKKIAHRVGERVGFLLGEGEDNDPIWVQSNAAFNSWVDSTAGLDAQLVYRMRRDWRNEYAEQRRETQSRSSFRKPSRLMRELDWDRRYRQLLAKGGNVGGEQETLLRTEL
jgi:transcriptional regulator with XRE-family HTH domain